MKTAIIKFWRRVVTGEISCRSCPHWIEMRRDTPQRGVCAISTASVFNQGELGFAYPAMYPQEFCPEHPNYDAEIVGGLNYAPSEKTKGCAGFSRIPTYEEAQAIGVSPRRKFVNAAFDLTKSSLAGLVFEEAMNEIKRVKDSQISISDSSANESAPLDPRKQGW